MFLENSCYNFYGSGKEISMGGSELISMIIVIIIWLLIYFKDYIQEIIIGVLGVAFVILIMGSFINTVCLVLTVIICIGLLLYLVWYYSGGKIGRAEIKTICGGITIILVVYGSVFFLSRDPKICKLSYCENKAAKNSDYCSNHADYIEPTKRTYSKYDNWDIPERYTTKKQKPQTTTKYYQRPDNNKYNNKNSYDEGYEDVYFNDDYDMDRYYSDDEYALGVDDALDDEDDGDW